MSKDYISDRSNENLLQPSSPEKVHIEYRPQTGEIEMTDAAVEVMHSENEMIMLVCVLNKRA